MPTREPPSTRAGRAAQVAGRAAPATGKLAPGMRLPREVVAASQRERLMIAAIEVVDAKGFPDTTVADLTARSQVSRSAFYEHFANVTECFRAAYDIQIARAAARLVSAYNAPQPSSRRRAHAALDAWASFAHSWPAAMRVCLRDVLTVRHGAFEHRAPAQSAARALVSTALGGDRGPHAPIAATLQTAVIGAVRRATLALLDAPDPADAGALADGLLDWLACYRGPAPDPAPQAPDPAMGPTAELAPDPVDADDPRARIERAVLDICARKGYDAMTHRDIARRAGVSYTTFYKHFDSKEHALLHACSQASERLTDAVAHSAAGAPDWPSRVRDAMAAYMRAVAADPAAARVTALDTLSLGRAGLAFRDRRAERLRELLQPGLQELKRPSPILADALAGATIELVHEHVLHERIERLPALAPILAHLLLAPFLGAAEAARIAARPPGW